MKYTIKNYKGGKFIVYSKKELFSIFDNFQSDWGRWSANIVNIYFTDNFIFSKEGRFVVNKTCYESKSPFHDNKYDLFYEITYVNALYIIYDVFGKKVDLTELKEQYIQSRKLNKNKVYYNETIVGSNKFRKTGKKSRFKDYNVHNSFTKEYRDNFSAIEQGVKVRDKRAKEVKSFHVFYYEDSILRTSTKCWKNKKIKKQWQKNK